MIRCLPMVVHNLIWLAVPALWCAGCASNPMKKPEAAIANVTPIRKGRAEEAIAEFERRRDQAQFTAALARWREGDIDECHIALDEIIQRNPEHTQARLLLSELLLAEKQPRLALEQVERVLEREPRNASAVHTAGLAYEAIGEDNVAREHFRLATELEPENEIFLLSFDVASETTPRLGDTPPVVLDDPANEQPAKSENGGRDDRTDPAEPWRDLLDQARFALRQHDDDAGREAFDRATRRFGDDPQVPISIGVLSLRYNRPELAREYVEAALTPFPNNPRLHRTLGLALYRLGEYEASQVSLRQALSLDNTDALSYVLLGSTLSQLGDRAAAESCLFEARRLDPSLAVSR